MSKSKTLLKGITTTAIALFAINKYIDKRSCDKNRVHNNGSYYHFKYGRVYYNTYGEGNPILLIHDQDVMASSYEWSKIIDTLSNQHKVFVLDLLGAGQSNKPNLTYTNYLYVELIHSFIEKIIQEPVKLITSHNAGSIGVMVNHLYKKDVNQLILINPNDLRKLTFETTRWDKILKQIIYLPIIGTAIYNAEYNEQKIRNVLRETYFKKASLADQYFDLYYQLAHHQESKNKYLYASIRCNYTNIDMRNGLKNKDNITMITSTERPDKQNIINNYLKVNPGINLIEIKNSKLFPQLENPKEVIEKIESL